MLTKKKFSVLLPAFALLFSMTAVAPTFAQSWGGDRGPGGPGGPMEHSFRGGEHGRWWDNPNVAQKLALTDDQKKKMDDIFQQHKLQLIDLNAALQKQEVLLRPLIEADQPDEQKVLSQIDAIAQARADLEKANARMLFGIRRVLTPDQWKKVQDFHRQMADRRAGPGGPGGPGRWRRGSDGQKGSGPGGPGGPGGPEGAPGPPPQGSGAE